MPDDRAPTVDDLHTQRREQMKAAILAHARAVMREDGVGGMSLAEIARRLGVKTPSLYEYFANKAAIYDALFRQGFEQFSARMEAIYASAPAGDPWMVLRAALEGYMSFAVHNPELYKLMFERPVPNFEPSDESMAVSLAALDAGRERFGAYVGDGLNLPDGLTIAEAHDLIIALIHGITALHMANQPHLPVGKGRFGHLIDAAVGFARDAWSRE
jgi:AcrR family transcriptional regulator